MLIIPDMAWEYYTPRYSRVVVKNDKVIAEGELYISFFEYGFGISGGESFIYVDMRNHSIDVSGDKVLSAEDVKGYAVYDASMAMGIYTKKTCREFHADMKKLRERAALHRKELDEHE